MASLWSKYVHESLEPKMYFLRRIARMTLLATASVLLSMNSASGAQELGPHVVRLAAGRVAQFRWAANVSRADRSANSTHLCLSIGLERPGARQHADPLEIPVEARECGIVTQRPIVSWVVDEIDSPHITLLAMAFSSMVDSVSLDIAGRRSRTVELSQLSAAKARKAGVVRFRFLPVALAGPVCIHRLLGRSSSGRVLYDSGPLGCT